MLDPLTALGLASNIVSFVDYGCKLISDGYELYEKGTLAGTEELELVAQDLVRLANDLTTHLPAPAKRLSADDSGLQQLAASCKSLADQLLRVLATLRPSNPQDGLECFRKAIRKARKRGTIENLEKRLEKIQTQLNIRLIAMLSNKQSDVLSALDILAVEAKQNGADVANQLDAIRLELLANIRVQQKQQKHSRGLTVNDEANIDLTCRKLAGKARWIASSQRVLKSLNYPYIKERESNVKDAHHHTFEWMLDDACSGTGPRTRFVEWLESGSGIYWIAGKAGSGKSTLVKYVSHHARTLKTLEAWAGSSRLVVASHFFWSAGNKMQKSQIGLLQSLLYQILRQCPGLIDIICSSRWSLDDFYDERPEPWTLRELSEAFLKLAACNELPAQSTKFCFFVDGLDEYDGEHTEVIRILQSMTKSPNIKICVSSRPWNIFEKTFGDKNCHKLLLQEFTSADIKLYVKAKLEDDETFSSLVREDSRYRQLIDDIVGKAQGVFLWVFLVVRSLLRGLADENEFSFLQRRINQLPSDLEDYFFHILDTIEPIYQEQTAQIFHLAIHSKKPLPAITLLFLEQEKTDPDYALKLQIHQIQETDIVMMSNRMKSHVNACCKDLLEVNIDPEESSFLQYKIDFLHRTVRDFLLTKDMTYLLKSRTFSTFNPQISLCRILLAQIKTYPLTIVKSSTLMSMIHELLQYCRDIEIYNQIPQIEILDELDKVLAITAQNRKKMGPFPPSYTGILRNYNITNLLELCVSSNLKLYISSKLTQNLILPPLKPNQKPLLYHALHMHRDDTLTFWDSDIEMVRLLVLSFGFSPNEKEAKRLGFSSTPSPPFTKSPNPDSISNSEQCTVWKTYLIRCLDYCIQDQLHLNRNSPSPHERRTAKDKESEAFAITELLIKSGADLGLRISTNLVGGTRTAKPRLDMGMGEMVVRVCEEESWGVGEILGGTFPGERGRIEELCCGGVGSSRGRGWGWSSGFMRWFWWR